MLSYRKLLTTVLTAACALLLLVTPGVAATKKSTPQKKVAGKKATGKKASAHKRRYVRKSSWKRRGQKGMDSERVREIQEALIREKYLSGDPTGVWDQHSKTAMQKYQADNGWQAKVVPDSRALIKLGLGPDHADLINPDTAAVLQPGGGAEKPPVPQVPQQNRQQPDKQ